MLHATYCSTHIMQQQQHISRSLFNFLTQQLFQLSYCSTGLVMSQEASRNSYLELRKEKIARNEKVLASLGLSKTAGKSPKQETKVREVESKNGDVNVAIVHTRRSSRLKSSSAPQVLYSPIKKDGLLDTVIPKTTSKRKRVDKSSRQIVKAETVQRIDAKPGTTRATFIDVQRVLCGNFDYPVFIGQRLSNTGKKAVIDHASLMCGNAPDISFNKYSGVCEFRNEAICLWVNIGDLKAELQNQFLDGGEKVRKV